MQLSIRRTAFVALVAVCAIAAFNHQAYSAATNPAPIPKLDNAQIQAKALATKLDVNYTKSFFGEVLDDLQKRAGLRFAYPGPLARDFLITRQEKGIVVKDLLELVADDGKVKLELLPDVAVFTRAAEAKLLADLKEKLALVDRWDRLEAVWDLSNLADRAIYPMLIGMFADSDAGVVEWTFRALEKHRMMLRFLDDKQKDIYVEAVMKHLPEDQRAAMMMLRGGFGMGQQSTGLAARFEAMASFKTEKAQDALTKLATEGPVNVRCSAMTYLAESGAAKASSTLIQIARDADAVIEKDKAAAANDPNPKNPGGGMDVRVGGGGGMIINGRQVPQEVMDANTLSSFSRTALSKMDSKEATDFLGDRKVPANPGRGGIGAWQAIPGGAGVQLTMPQNPAGGATVDAYVKNVTRLLDMNIDPATRPAVGGVMVFDPRKMGRPDPMDGVIQSAGYSLSQLILFDPHKAHELMNQVLKDEKAVELLMGAQSWDANYRFTITEDNLDLVLALVNSQRAQVRRFAARCLGTITSDKAIDALATLLKDADAQVRADAATSLAGTRSPRALELIAAAVRGKFEWPDYEKEAQEAMKKGMGVRNPQNPLKQVVAAIVLTRDPKAMETLAALSKDETVPPEGRTAALNNMADCTYNAATTATLFAIVEKFEPNPQREVLTRGTSMWGWGARPMTGTPACYEDPRWEDLAMARVQDHEATRMYNGKTYGNSVIDVLGQTGNPRAERTLLKLTKDPEEHMAYFAARALNGYNDPQVEVQYKK